MASTTTNNKTQAAITRRLSIRHEDRAIRFAEKTFAEFKGVDFEYDCPDFRRYQAAKQILKRARNAEHKGVRA